ncbi:sorbitol dehydrogenase, partial [Agrilus planipennis]|uniref:Sorbitol dehydrogenase n=1 Tax=Agrilus planipennis TaxID=224129 RepID=A0A1W4X585_AGRPL
MAPPSSNLSAVLYGINDLRLEERPVPEPKDNQALLRMEVVGIWWVRRTLLDHRKMWSVCVEKPMVIGHEASGTVLKVGKNVK